MGLVSLIRENSMKRARDVYLIQSNSAKWWFSLRVTWGFGGPGFRTSYRALFAPRHCLDAYKSDGGKGVTRPHRAPVAQNVILGPENPKSETSRSVTWRCLIQTWWCSEYFAYVYVYWIRNSGLRTKDCACIFSCWHGVRGSYGQSWGSLQKILSQSCQNT